MFEIVPGRTPLVRTWFEDDAAWNRFVTAVRTPAADGHAVNVQLIDDVVARDLSSIALAGLHPVPTGLSIVLVADERTQRDPEIPVLALLANGSTPPESLRVSISKLYDFEVNLSLGNLDWQDFAGHASPDGVFKGFSPSS